MFQDKVNLAKIIEGTATPRLLRGDRELVQIQNKLLEYIGVPVVEVITQTLNLIGFKLNNSLIKGKPSSAKRSQILKLLETEDGRKFLISEYRKKEIVTTEELKDVPEFYYHDGNFYTTKAIDDSLVICAFKVYIQEHNFKTVLSDLLESKTILDIGINDLDRLRELDFKFSTLANLLNMFNTQYIFSQYTIQESHLAAVYSNKSVIVYPKSVLDANSWSIEKGLHYTTLNDYLQAVRSNELRYKLLELEEE